MTARIVGLRIEKAVPSPYTFREIEFFVLSMAPLT